MPLFIYHDDLETGNVLGSHSKINEVGTVYCTKPCFPQNFSSKLQSIIMSDVFYSNDWKQYGNIAVFQYLIKDLNMLRKERIKIFVDGQIIQIYFVTSLIIGDNLRLNNILGFVSSFVNTHWCRICYTDSEKAGAMSREDVSLLRTFNEYEIDVIKIFTCDSGIVNKNIFNSIEGYHCITNLKKNFL